jgi:cytochrome c-type biogenesis protein CcmH/NrfF
MAQTNRNLMRAWMACGAIVALACAMVIVPVSHAQQTVRAKTVGKRLMCMCGCNQVLVECNHINCPSSAPMLKELDTHIASGEADDLVVQDFIQEYGVAVLSSPPNSGFTRMAWLLPGIAFAVGLALVALIIGRWRHNDLEHAPVPAAKSAISPDAIARAREKVDRETEI